MKLTKSDIMINWFTVLIFCFQVQFIIIFLIQLLLVAIFGPIGVRNVSVLKKWYIDNDSSLSARKAFVIPMRFLLLNSSMIPISLKVTLEVCKVFYTLFIDYDEHL